MPEFYNDEQDFDDDDDNCGDCGQCEDCMENELAECGMQPDGGCDLAGTEYCDFDCKLREIWEEDDA